MVKIAPDKDILGQAGSRGQGQKGESIEIAAVAFGPFAMTDKNRFFAALRMTD